MAHHAEDYTEGADVDGEYFSSYADPAVHEAMVRDKPRMDFYKRALSPEALTGRVVVDVGAGTGILSLLAARAGAKKVYAVEASGLSTVLQRIVDHNRMQDVITVISDTVETAVIPETVDIVISEWMGFYLLHEAMLQSVLAARDRFLGPNPAPWQMIPSSADILCAPVQVFDAMLAERNQFWGDIEGFDLSPMSELAMQVNTACNPMIEVVPASALLAEPKLFASLPLHRTTAADLASLTRNVAFSIDPSEKDRRVEGLTFWFTTTYSGGEDGGGGITVLDTAPSATPTHWKQATLLLPDWEDSVVPVPAGGEPMTIGFGVTMEAEEGTRCYAISVQLYDPDDN